jgi:hypothetical protein
MYTDVHFLSRRAVLPSQPKHQEPSMSRRPKHPALRPRDLEILRLVYVAGFRQADVARLYGLSQPRISRLLKVAVSFLIADLRSPTPEELLNQIAVARHFAREWAQAAFHAAMEQFDRSGKPRFLEAAIRLSKDLHDLAILPSPPLRADLAQRHNSLLPKPIEGLTKSADSPAHAWLPAGSAPQTSVPSRQFTSTAP